MRYAYTRARSPGRTPCLRARFSVTPNELRACVLEVVRVPRTWKSNCAKPVRFVQHGRRRLTATHLLDDSRMKINRSCGNHGGSCRMSPDFTPLSGFPGGTLIGLAALLLLIANGRIAGVSGIVAAMLAGFLLHYGLGRTDFRCTGLAANRRTRERRESGPARAARSMTSASSPTPFPTPRSGFDSQEATRRLAENWLPASYCWPASACGWRCCGGWPERF